VIRQNLSSRFLLGPWRFARTSHSLIPKLGVNVDGLPIRSASAGGPNGRELAETERMFRRAPERPEFERFGTTSRPSKITALTGRDCTDVVGVGQADAENVGCGRLAVGGKRAAELDLKGVVFPENAVALRAQTIFVDKAGLADLPAVAFRPPDEDVLLRAFEIVDECVSIRISIISVNYQFDKMRGKP
jgi:hypothetical protein